MRDDEVRRVTFARLTVCLLSMVLVVISLMIALIVTGDVWSNVHDRITTQPAEFTKQVAFYFGLWVSSFGFTMLFWTALTRSRRAGRLAFVSLVCVMPILIVVASVAGTR